MEQTFNERHAREILKPCNIDAYIKIDERGVWPKTEYDSTEEQDLFLWSPAQVFRGELGAPEEADTPMLPLPFTARDLAAFMTEGVGALVSGFYGDYENGPDPASLKEIDPRSHARIALIQAYAARCEAEHVVGAYPLELDAEAERARKAWRVATTAANMREGVSGSIPGTDESRLRRARAVASVVQQDTEMEAANKEARTAHEVWLNAMVRQLLQPAPAQGPAAPAPVVAPLVEPDKAGPVANWKMQIQVEATALCLRLRKSGANPTRHSIIDPMARWCRENGVKTDGGIYPKEGYLRTHVLGGKHWDVPN